MSLFFQYFSDVSETGNLQKNVVKNIQRDLKNFCGKRVEICIEKVNKKRTNKQNNTYWMYVGIISKETGNDKDELHDLFKRKFLKKVVEIPNVITGEMVQEEGTNSTKELTTTEFAELIDHVQKFAAEYLSIALPDPGEQTELNYNQQKTK